MLDVLGNAVDKFVGLDPSELSDGELHHEVVGMQREIDRLQAAQATRLSEWDARKIWANNGAKSAGARLARETGLAPSTAKHLVHRARRLRSMPLCSRAFADGELSSSRVDLLVRANQPAVSDLFSRDEGLLVEKVSELRYLDAQETVEYWSQCANEARCENKARRQVQQRYVSAVKTFGGNVDVRALLDPVNGEIFLDELKSIEDEIFKADWAQAKQVHGEDVRVEHLARTPAQRRADALVEMAKRSASRPPGAVAPRPLVTVVVGYETFAGRVCELASGTVVAPGQIVPMLTNADIERIVFDGPSRVIDVGAKRLFKGALRRAIEIRDRHCQHPSGCDEPAERCHVDHDEAYTRGGPTTQENGQLLCATHNRAKGPAPP